MSEKIKIRPLIFDWLQFGTFNFIGENCAELTLEHIKNIEKENAELKSENDKLEKAFEKCKEQRNYCHQRIGRSPVAWLKLSVFDKELEEILK